MEGDVDPELVASLLSDGFNCVGLFELEFRGCVAAAGDSVFGAPPFTGFLQGGCGGVLAADRLGWLVGETGSGTADQFGFGETAEAWWGDAALLGVVGGPEFELERGFVFGEVGCGLSGAGE